MKEYVLWQSSCCLSALQDPLAEEILLQKPNANAVHSLQTVIQIQSELNFDHLFMLLDVLK